MPVVGRARRRGTGRRAAAEAPRLRYYGADGELRFETPPRQGADEPPAELGADWLGPEGLHAVENIDDRPFRALRVELKDAG